MEFGLYWYGYIYPDAYLCKESPTIKNGNVYA